jgi:hypothetical protein
VFRTEILAMLLVVALAVGVFGNNGLALVYAQDQRSCVGLTLEVCEQVIENAKTGNAVYEMCIVTLADGNEIAVNQEINIDWSVLW